MIRHKKRLDVADAGSNPNEVYPSNWNDDHAVDGVLGVLLDIGIAPESFPYITADGQGALASISAPARAVLAGGTYEVMRTVLGAASADNALLTGAPRAPTAALGTNTDQIATMAALKAMRDDLVAAAPGALDTLNELAAALGNDPNYAATISAALGNRLRVDAVQSLSSGQKAFAVGNLGLAAVAVTGNYADLAGRPTFGTAAGNALQLDGSGRLPAVDGSQLTNLPAQSGAVLYNAAQSLSPAQRLQAYTNAGLPFQCGKLTYVSSSALKFAPRNGDLIKINGAVYRIPAAGIAGLGNTAAFVNGVGASILAASTVYRVYAFVNAGVITADFRTGAHATSATAGNEGVEILSGDDSRTLIGMVLTDGTGNFSNFATLSWFNRGGKTALITGSSTGTSASMSFIAWGEDSVSIHLQGWIDNSSGAYNGSGILVDGASPTSWGNATGDTVAAGVSRLNASLSGAIELSEGLHTAGASVFTGGGTATLHYTLQVNVRG
ncbi:hypothetical protein [Rhodopseudomonas sp. B29]|uniref:hypothetical protein n=1 Tax=Rhodopseudomonas sp. B29 TaxID=95607 RepID=UPI0003B336EB|nr:hypothetical protein [Rhodopseudomonas sp. B29]